MEQIVTTPTKEDFADWRNSPVTKFYHAYMSKFIEAYLEKVATGDLVEGETIESIALNTIRDQTRLAIFTELYRLGYEDIYHVVVGETYEDISGRPESFGEEG